ncbi:MAG: PPC domain-containing protein, partial [Woeseia sp.]
AETGLSGGSGAQLFFTLEVPAGQTSLDFDMSGGSGDADMYVKFASAPTTGSYDCRPYLNGNTESCSFTNPAAGTWHVMINGYSSFSGVSLTGTYAGGGGGGGGSCPAGYTEYSGSLGGTGSEAFEPNGTYYYTGSSGTHAGILSGTGSDFDLYLRKWNGNGWSNVASSTSSSSNENISYGGSSGYYTWRVYSYSGAGTYNLCLKTP